MAHQSLVRCAECFRTCAPVALCFSTRVLPHLKAYSSEETCTISEQLYPAAHLQARCGTQRTGQVKGACQGSQHHSCRLIGRPEGECHGAGCASDDRPPDDRLRFLSPAQARVFSWPLICADVWVLLPQRREGAGDGVHGHHPVLSCNVTPPCSLNSCQPGSLPSTHAHVRMVT